MEGPSGAIQLVTPLAEADVRALRAGDVVSLTGTIFTLRDQAHLRALEKGPPVDLRRAAVYHCGPLAVPDGTREDGWRVLAAGPTTSIRMESVEPEFLRRFRPGAIIGKGGMGPGTLEAMMEVGAVYLAWTGGAAILAARAIERVAAVHWPELGIPEAVWELEVEDFGPMVVGMDAKGGDLYRDVRERVEEGLPEVRGLLGI
ncbi:MAG: FumA C-terminus/TtdB family hydratase beta subunit [Candidatus Dadabacteria bacterium]|nr:FumA C-terminus/TtdB family hydratase beta subunit [Candidatus Dadabacteria bacterium]